MPTVAQGRRRQIQTASDPEIAVVADRPAPDVARSHNAIRFWTGWGLVFLSQAPLVAIHLTNLWKQPRYQFYPLFVLLLSILAWTRWTNVLNDIQKTPLSTGESWMKRLRMSLLLGSLIVLTGAAFVGSPWMGMVSCLLALTSLALTTHRHMSKSGLFAVVSALWILVPPPFNLDIRLVQFLQRQTAMLSSKFLDLLEYNHLLEGTVIQFTNRQVLVEEACSGVQSFFALVAVSILYGLWNQRQLWHILALIIGSGCWSLAGNILRILAITLIDPITRLDLSTGWGHELLGLVAFAFSFVLLVSFDHLLQFMTDPVEGIDGEPTPLSLGWNRWVAGKIPSSTTNPDTQDFEQFQAAEPAVRKIIMTPLPWWCVGLFAAVIALQINFYSTGNAAVPRSAAAPADHGHLTRNSLPAELGKWQLKQFEVERRSDGRSEGGISRIWNYRDPTYDATVSLDYPFIDSHNLTTCYIHRGWIVTQKTVHQSQSPTETPPYVEVRFRRPTGEAGYLLFALFDDQGRPMTAPATPDEYWRRFLNRIAGTRLREYFDSSRNTGARVSGDVYQLQIFISTHVDLTQRQSKVLHQQFHNIYGRILSDWQTQGSGT
ncbi:MAG: exosortase U [Planctomycetaceae bacterium]